MYVKSSNFWRKLYNNIFYDYLYVHFSFPFISIDFDEERDDISRSEMCFFITRIPEKESERWIFRNSDREMFFFLSEGFRGCNSYILKEKEWFWISDSKRPKVIDIFECFYGNRSWWKDTLYGEIFFRKIANIVHGSNLFPDSFFE